MRRRAAAACIAVFAGLAGLLQHTLLQMAIVSDLHPLLFLFCSL